MYPPVPKLALLALLWLAASPLAAQEVAVATYLRTDTDSTVVVAPRHRVQVPVGEATKIDAVYAVDIWTSASIDIRTSASKQVVTEQRNEFDLGVSHEFEELTLGGGYRFSHEPDYVSHGGSLSASHEFADNNATIGGGLSASIDDVGRAGSPNFSRGLSTLGGRVSFTQVLDANMFATLLYDLNSVSGYQSSPYRYVAIGGSQGSCWRDPTPKLMPGIVTPPLTPPAPLCVPEGNPEHRLRHAIALQGRRALGESLSMGAAYRLYFDSWGLSSHTLKADLSWLVGGNTILAAGYRFYVQGAASHYAPNYTSLETFVTSDKELSAMSAHRIALEIEHVFELGDRGAELKLNLSVAPSIYLYNEFPLLDEIKALDVNSAVVLVL